MVTTCFDSSERGAIGAGSIYADAEKLFPVVWSNTVQCLAYALQGVRLHLGRAARPAIKRPAKIVQGLPAVCLFADDRIRLQPYQQPFVVKIHSAPQRLPIASRLIEKLSGHGCVGQRSPLTTRTVVEYCGRQ